MNVRLIVRQLLKTPGYTFVVIATLGLGIGANTAIFSVVYGVLLRPLPYPDADRLVVVLAEKYFPAGLRVMNFSAAEMDDWTTHNRAFDSVAMHGASVYALRSAAGMQSVSGAWVTADFFDTLGSAMTLGRPITVERDPVVVISHRLWQRQFGQRVDIVGQQARLNDQAYTIIGVAPPEFAYPRANSDVWMPLAYARDRNMSPSFRNRNGGGFTVIARLRSRVTLDQARDDAAAVVRTLEPHFDDHRRGLRPIVTLLSTQVAGTIRPALVMLLVAVGFLLLVACANVANLMVARQGARARETAVRFALGASRRQVIAQLLSESAVLSAAGAGVGVLIAMWCTALLRWATPSQIPRLEDIRVDAPVLLFAMVAATATVAIAGAAAAVTATRSNVVAALKTSARTQTGRHTRRLRSTLVVAELAIAMVLLIGASLLARSLVALLDTDLGVSTDNVVTAQVDLSLGRSVPREQWPLIADRLLQRVAALPGIEVSGIGSGLPPNALYMRQSFTLANPVSGINEEHLVSVVPATAGYFTTLGISVVKGRLFSAADGTGAAPVVVITDDLARRLFGDTDPIGQQVPGGGTLSSTATTSTVIGVVRNVKYTGIDAPVEGVVYRPFAQYPWRVLFVVARTGRDSASVVADLRSVVREIDPEINIMNARSIADVVHAAVAQPRFRTTVFSSIAVMTLLLAIVGLYGVMAYTVSQRTTEIGVRVAVGARGVDVMSLLMREAGALIVAGVVIGAAVAYALSTMLAAFLYGVTATDPSSFAIAAALVASVGTAATMLPARRATRIDPIVALRGD